MIKNLQFKSVDLLKYTENVVDKQPKKEQIQEIVNTYVEAIHPTHLAIEIPLDDNAEFLAHQHVPAPLTIDEFTRIWIDTIHDAGVNVYFRGTFSGIKNLYDFGFDITTPLGTADTAITDGKTTWLGRYYLWLNTQLGNMKPGDILGIVPDATTHAFDGSFFVPSSGNMALSQANFLNFFTEVKKLTDAITQPIGPIYTGFSSNLYKDIANGWIPAFLYDLVGMMVVSYYGDEQTPQEMEKTLNDLYTFYHQPIFLSEWQIPRTSVLYPTIDNNPQEFFEAFSRLRDKGILVGLNYFDGLSYEEGIFTHDDLNDKGHLLGAFYAQGGRSENPALKKEEKTEEKGEKKESEPTPNITQQNQTTSDSAIPSAVKAGVDALAHTLEKAGETLEEGIKEGLHKTPQKKQKKTPSRNKKGIWSKEKQTLGTIPFSLKGTGDGTIGLHKHDVPFLVKVGFYLLFGASATEFTNILTNSSFSYLTPYVMIIYTLLIAIGHAALDGK